MPALFIYCNCKLKLNMKKLLFIIVLMLAAVAVGATFYVASVTDGDSFATVGMSVLSGLCIFAVVLSVPGREPSRRRVSAKRGI